jgi:hypothetical protein
VIAQESASTPQWRTRRALFSRLLTTILRHDSENWLRFASNGDWRAAVPPRFFRCAYGLRRERRSPTLPPKLFGLLGPLTLAKADARAAAILVDELNARLFEGTSDFVRCFRTTCDRPIN